MVRITEEEEDEAHDKHENKEYELEIDPNENCEKIDETNELLSEDLKLQNEWQQESQIWN